MGRHWSIFGFFMKGGGRKTFPLLSALRTANIILKGGSRLGDSFSLELLGSRSMVAGGCFFQPLMNSPTSNY